MLRYKRAISACLVSIFLMGGACNFTANATCKTVFEENTNLKSKSDETAFESSKSDLEKNSNKPEKSNFDESKDKKLAKIKKFLSVNSKYLPKKKIKTIKKKLMKLSEKEISSLNSLDFTDPAIMTIISVFFGGLGVDRMMIGHIGKGVLKFLTSGGFGIWWFIDMFRISGLTKNENYKALKEVLDV